MSPVISPVRIFEPVTAPSASFDVSITSLVKCMDWMLAPAILLAVTAWSCSRSVFTTRLLKWRDVMEPSAILVESITWSPSLADVTLPSRIFSPLMERSRILLPLIAPSVRCSSKMDSEAILEETTEPSAK